MTGGRPLVRPNRSCGRRPPGQTTEQRRYVYVKCNNSLGRVCAESVEYSVDARLAKRTFMFPDD